MKIYSFIAEEQANHSIWTVKEMCVAAPRLPVGVLRLAASRTVPA